MRRKTVLQLFFYLAASSVVAQSSGFVSLAGRDFILDGEPFYPRVMNFGTELVAMNTPVTDVDELWSTVETAYDWSFQLHESDTEAEFQQQLADHFNKIRSMGFNTVRLSLPVLMHWDAPGGQRRYSIVYFRHEPWARYFLDLDMNGFLDAASAKHFDLIRELIRSADSEGLKVILICAEDLGDQPQLTPATDALAAQHYGEYLTRLAEELKDEPGLLAYDLWNEPIWTSYAMADLSKATVCEYTTQWYDAIRSTGDTHLITLGGSSVPELGSWDPAIMKIDFYSPHIYPNFSRLDGYDHQGGLDRIVANLHWQARSCPIPWLIGETGFAAEDDEADPMDLNNNSPDPILVSDPATHRMPYMMGSEQEQADFFTHTMNVVRNNLGSGYSWWGFQNGRNHVLVRPEDYDPYDPTPTDPIDKEFVEKYHQNFWGPLKYGNPGSLNLLPPWDEQNRWRDKDMVAAVQNYTLPPAPTELPAPPANYYNWYNLNTDVWRDGYVVDQNGQPVPDAVIEVPWEYVLNFENPPPMPAWSFTEWMPYVTDESGHFSVMRPPTVAGFVAPDVDDEFISYVNAAGAARTEVGETGSITAVQRDLLPYSATVQVLVEMNNERIYFGRTELEVTSGTVEGGANGGQADLFAAHSVHISAPFHAEAGSETHIYTAPVFPECPEPGSGMIPEPASTASSAGFPKSRVAVVQLRFGLAEMSVIAFPSPACDFVTIECTKPEYEYSVFDVEGRVVRGGQSHSERTMIDVSSLASGNYRCAIASGSQSTNTSFNITR